MRKLFFNIGWCFAITFVFLGFLMNIRKAKKMAKFHTTNPNYYFSHERYKIIYKICKKILYIKKVSTCYHNVDNIPKKPALFIANHKSNIDGIILLKKFIEYKSESFPTFDFFFVAKKELKQGKMVSSILNLLNTVYLDRSDIRQQFEMFNLQLKYIKENKRSAIIFIEGTRVYNDEFGEFKHGAFEVGLKSFIPIVPVVLYGTSGILDSNKSHHNKKHNTYINFLTPLDPHEIIGHNSIFLSDKVKDLMYEEYLRIKECVIAKKQVFKED